ncbi:putative C-type lectin domain family 20 member A [Hemibagrus wyckioides]|uniref:putative C-type lectin domain family 20 member A n=1 Tax=Hemibagrus wyckioides TaxID=337641 RepID=UPI00266BE3A0|nr:putative C-type lectin domain family 20 member A [Hemibagrus wyckioides]XP_058241253.1 putative C-type lectin domain family 20 member A [Hemibagrus wyckioides]
MTLNLFLLLNFTGLVPVAILRTILHKYDLMMTQVSWPVAQNYCRVTYTDLATVVSDSDWLRFKNEAANKHLAANAWVGLYNDINSWRWSLNDLPLKNVTYSCWVSGQPDNLYGNEACGIIGYYNAWWDVPCAGLRPFICYNANFSGTARFIGIATSMSWPQAQAYCRTHHTDLASALNSSDNNMLVQIKNIQGDSWIGLYRDTWKWSDGTIASNLLWYPGQPDNYGGVENCAVVYNGLFYDAPCANLYYFFCHSITIKRSQTMRLQVMSDGSVFDPVVQLSILEQMKQKLKEKGMLENTTVTWRLQPDGNIFQKIKDDL